MPIVFIVAYPFGCVKNLGTYDVIVITLLYLMNIQVAGAKKGVL